MDTSASNFINSGELFRITQELSNPISKTTPLAHSQELCQQMAEYFHNKILKLRASIPSLVAPSVSHPALELSGDHTIIPLREFTPLTEVSVREIIRALKASSSPLDPCPPNLMKSCAEALAPFIQDIINS